MDGLFCARGLARVPRTGEKRSGWFLSAACVCLSVSLRPVCVSSRFFWRVVVARGAQSVSVLTNVRVSRSGLLLFGSSLARSPAGSGSSRSGFEVSVSERGEPGLTEAEGGRRDCVSSWFFLARRCCLGGAVGVGPRELPGFPGGNIDSNYFVAPGSSLASPPCS